MGALWAGAACTSDDRPDRAPATADPRPSQVRHLPTYLPPFGFAPEESTEVGVLALDDRTGCLTWEGHPIVFPRGSDIADDGTIVFPDGDALRWWEKSSFYQTRTIGGRVDDTFRDLDDCLSDQRGPLTLVWVTGVPGSSTATPS